MLLVVAAELLAVEDAHVAESIAEVGLADLTLGPRFGAALHLSLDPLCQALCVRVLHGASALAGRNHASLVLALQTDAALSRPLLMLAVVGFWGWFFCEPDWDDAHV